MVPSSAYPYKFIYQGVLDNDHSVSLNDLLLRDNVERVVFNVAFVKTSGINLLYDGLRQIKERGQYLLV